MKIFCNAISFRALMLFIALGCVLIVGSALYLQYQTGLMPCPMCIVQRYAYIGVALCCFIAAWGHAPGWRWLWAGLALVSASLGAFTAGRQSWIQWYPPEITTCGRDFYGMVEQLPMSRFVPMLFKGSGDCAAVDWMWMGLTIANLSFVALVAMAIGLVWAIASKIPRQ